MRVQEDKHLVGKEQYLRARMFYSVHADHAALLVMDLGSQVLSRDKETATSGDSPQGPKLCGTCHPHGDNLAQRRCSSEVW